MIKIIHKYNENIYFVILSLFISLWFYSVNRIFSYYLGDNPLNCIIYGIISLIILYSDDNKLTELYKFRNVAIVGTQDRPRR